MKKIAFVTTLFVFLLTACGNSNNITVMEEEFSFTPASITVQAGEPVTLTIQNTGAVEHDFVIEKIDVTNVQIVQGHLHDHETEVKYDLHVSTQPERESIIEFTATEPGTYRIFCSVAGHVEAGMVGELIVVVE